MYDWPLQWHNFVFSERSDRASNTKRAHSLTHSLTHLLSPSEPPNPASGRHRTTSNCGAWTMRIGRRRGRTDGKRVGQPRTNERTNDQMPSFALCCVAVACVQRASERASSVFPFFFQWSWSGGGGYGTDCAATCIPSCNVTIVIIKSV